MNETAPRYHVTEFSAEILRRGFWLYVWEIELINGKKKYYVGRTGDSSSQHASAPYSRMSQHLGNNNRNNTLSKHLEKLRIKPKNFRLHTYGPIFPEQDSLEDHRVKRDLVAAYERELCNLLKLEFGFDVLNSVHCRLKLDAIGWAPIKAAFNEKLLHHPHAVKIS